MTNVFENIGLTYRPLNYKHRPESHLYVGFRANSDVLRNKHSGNAYFLTWSLGKTELSVEEEWLLFGKQLERVLKRISKAYLIAGLLTGIEMYGKSQNRMNSKALRPHVHMVIYTYNDFLGFPKEDLEVDLVGYGLDFKLDYLATSRDVAKASCYTVKSAKQATLKYITYHFFVMESIRLLVNYVVKDNRMSRWANSCTI